MVLPFALWGTAMAAMKPLLVPLAPLELAWLRLMPAGLIILGAAALLKRPLGVDSRDRGWFFLFVLVDAALFQGFLGPWRHDGPANLAKADFRVQRPKLDRQFRFHWGRDGELHESTSPEFPLEQEKPGGHGGKSILLWCVVEGKGA